MLLVLIGRAWRRNVLSNDTVRYSSLMLLMLSVRFAVSHLHSLSSGSIHIVVLVCIFVRTDKLKHGTILISRRNLFYFLHCTCGGASKYLYLC